ncbi:MAG TPA: hypothetical protein VIZ17_20820 [Acetobacteraceae bacterium]
MAGAPANGGIGGGSAVGAWTVGVADAVSAGRPTLVGFSALRDGLVGDDFPWRAATGAKVAFAPSDAAGAAVAAGAACNGANALPAVVPLAASVAINWPKGIGVGVLTAPGGTVSLPAGTTAACPGSDTAAAIWPGMHTFSLASKQ